MDAEPSASRGSELDRGIEEGVGSTPPATLMYTKFQSYARLAIRQASMGSVEFTPLNVISFGRMNRARLVTMYEKPDHCSFMIGAPCFGCIVQMSIERASFVGQI